MAKAHKLRFLDTSDKDNHQFVTLYLDGEFKGFFKRDSKEVIQKSAEGTTCKPQKHQLTEVRLIGYGWKYLDPVKFQKMLNEINIVRVKRKWQPIDFPVDAYI